jgi:uncharacterized protein YjiS (DUF1127 family)
MRPAHGVLKSIATIKVARRGDPYPIIIRKSVHSGTGKKEFDMTARDTFAFEPTPVLGSGGPLARQLARLLRRFRTRREAREIRRTARTLAALGDDTLRDIGLSRGSIEARLLENSMFNRNR